MGYLYLSLAIFGTSIGQLLLKKHNMQNSKISTYLIFALLLLVSVPIFIYLSLIYISFTIVFLSDLISIIIIVILSGIFLNESISNKKILGIVFIVLGIFGLKRYLL